MNTLNIFPKKLRKKYLRNIKDAGIRIAPQKYHFDTLLIGVIVSIILTVVLYFFNLNVFISFFALFIVSQLFFYLRLSLAAAFRIKKMEDAFPDVIELMSSNLRAGMTVDRAFLLSARPEFYPLNEEIINTGKEIATGKDIALAFVDMSERINSEKISKTVNLIISGLKAGGNISVLLEQTASNMREKEFIERRAASNVLMYVIFIFVAAGIGAPALFALSTILIQVIMNVVTNLPVMESTQMSLPLTFKGLELSLNFVIYFSVAFIVVTDTISCLVIGLVNKGNEKYGLRYLVPMLMISLVIFFSVRIFLYRFVASSFNLF